MDALVTIQNLHIAFGDQQAIAGLNLTLGRGETLGLVGESGSGKSLTALAILGLVPPEGRIQGEIFFAAPDRDRLDLQALPEWERRSYRGGQIAMIFQEPMSSFNPVYSIGFQITEAILNHARHILAQEVEKGESLSPTEARRRTYAALQQVQLLPSEEGLQRRAQEALGSEASREACDRWINQQKRSLFNRYPHQLSGGQLQRAMIAMAIACRPVLLIADEPTTALDVTVQAGILQLLRDLCAAQGMSLIFITHDLGVVADLVDRVAVMYRGQVVESQSVADLFTQPQHPYTKGLLACRPRLGEMRPTLPVVADFMEEIATPEGPRIQEKAAPPLPDLITDDMRSQRLQSLAAQDPLIRVEQLRVGYGAWWGTQHLAVRGVSFDLYPGETLGLVGESGCGKSTLARAILRLLPAQGGRVHFSGHNLLGLRQGSKTLRQLRRQMQVVFQNPYNALNPRMTIGAAILEPLVVHGVGDRQKHKQRVRDLLDQVGLDPSWGDRYPHELSGGQRQRVCIARALALNPQVIICDESVSALDVSVQAQVLNLLKRLQREYNLAYLFISHDLSVVEFMSDRILVMYQGEIVESGPAQAIYRTPQREYTKQLIAAIPQERF